MGPHGDPGRRRGGGKLVGEVDVGLKSGKGGVGELHGITVELLEVMAWLKKGRGELSTVDRGCSGGPVKAVEQRKEEGNSGRVRGKRSQGASWSMLQD
jgi:hypothetical protein